MAEQKLEIVKNGKYNNIFIKPAPKKGQSGLDAGNHIIVKKTFAQGRPFESKYGTSFSCGVEYLGEKCSFWLNEKEHEAFQACGGEGDTLKITLTEEPWLNKKTGVKMLLSRLSFELVQ